MPLVGWGTDLLLLCAQSPRLSLGAVTGLFSVLLTPAPLSWELPKGLDSALFISYLGASNASAVC